MELRSTKKLGVFLLPCVLLAFPTFVHATDTTQSTNAATVQATNTTTEQTADKSNVNYDQEVDKAKAAGYSETQAKQILNMPDVAGQTSVSPAKLDMSLMQRSANQQSQVVNEALRYLGVPYAWGGATPAGFDCSGLVQYAYKAIGVNLPRVTYDQEKQGTEVSLNALQPGDLLFYGSRGATYHVAMYIGNGQMVHAPQPGDVVKIVNMQYFMPSFARRIVTDSGSSNNVKPTAGPMYRLYNPNSGEHFYTSSTSERNSLTSIGWTLEGTAWTAPSSGAPVYRLYNPNAGDHHYTLNTGEKDSLIRAGWQYEGISWYSSGDKTLLRLYNPNAKGAGAHHYTLNTSEKNNLVNAGWKFEGNAWQGK